MTNFLRRIEDERGVALALAIMMMLVLTASVTTALYVTRSSASGSHLSKSRVVATNLAESGINNAMAVLRLPTNNALNPTVFCPGTTQVTINGQTVCKTTNSYPGGTVTWWGTLDGFGRWSLTSVGTVKNPTGSAGGDVTRTMTASVQVHPTLTQPLNTPIWDYIYSTKPASPLPTCDMTVTSSVTIASPLYVEGNLCLNQQSAITKGPLIVRGRLYLANKKTSGNPGNYVGQAAAPVSDVHIVNGCDYNNTLYTSPCPKDGTANIWAGVSDATVPTTLSPPIPNYNQWYLNASPGPYAPCATIDGNAPIAGYPVFDSPVSTAYDSATRLTFRNNNQPVQDLTPASSYRCQTAAGELSWDAALKKLTIHGTIYIDGSLYVQNGAVNQYTGQGVIYLSGTFLVKNSSFCGKVYNGACDNRNPSLGGWDPNTSLVCIVAEGTGGQVSSGDSVQLVSSAMQGAAYANGNVDIGTTSTFAGPLVGSSVILGQSVTTSFPSISIVPDGMPSNPTAYAEADPPVYG
jgi:Tfp pilus assembly protein PilX